MDGVRKEKQALGAKITRLEEKVKGLSGEIDSLQAKVTALGNKGKEALDAIKELRKQRDDGVSLFH